MSWVDDTGLNNREELIRLATPKVQRFVGLAGTPDLHVGASLPIFQIDPEKAKATNDLESCAYSTGRVHFQISAPSTKRFVSAMTASVVGDAVKEVRIVSRSTRDQNVAAAVQTLRNDATIDAVRMLEMPQQFITGLWIHHSNDMANEVLLVDAKPTFPLKTNVRYTEADFLKVLGAEPIVTGIQQSTLDKDDDTGPAVV